MDRYQILRIDSIFIDAQNPSAAKVDHTVFFDNAHDFTDSVELWARTIIHQIAGLQLIVSPAVKWQHHRQFVEAI